MNFYFRPIIPLTLAMVFGIAAGECIPGYRPAAWCITAGGVFLLVFSVYRRREGRFFPLILFFALGYLLIQPWTDPKFPPQHIFRAATGEKAMVTGVVTTAPVVTGFRQRFIIETETLGGDTNREGVEGKLRVSLSGTEPVLGVGDRISFVGRIRPIRGFKNPGGFDYNRYMAFKGVWASATGQGASVTVLAKAVPVGIEVWIDPFRASVAKIIHDAAAGDAAEMLKALLLGERDGISESMKEDFQRIGIGHLLAISGLHVGLVAGVVFFFCIKIFGHVPVLLRRAWVAKSAALPAFIAVMAYGLLAGMSPSTQRAVIMAGVFLATFFVQRPPDTLNAVAVAACLILVCHPPSLFAASFQLSFAAVTVIVLWLSLVPVRNFEGVSFDTWRVLLKKTGTFMMVSLAAILGTLPLALFYFNEISLIGLVSNLIFIPIIGFGVVPLGLTSVFLCLASPALAAIGFTLCGKLISGAFILVRWASSLPFASLTTVTPSVIEILLYYCLLISVWLMVHCMGNRKKRWHPERSRFGSLRFAILLVTVSVTGLILDGYYWGYQRFWTDKLKITIIDVGHGNASLVEIPGGEVVLIDGGGFSDNSVYDVGKRIVAPLLWRKKIRTVQTLMLSHPDSDHLNGLIYIAEQFHVSRLLSNSQPGNTKGYGKLMSAVRENGIKMPDYEGTVRNWSMGDIAIEILYPTPGFLDKRNLEPWRDENNNSLVVRISRKEVSFLFPGDIEAEGEQDLVATVEDRLQARILVAPHHGSRTSSTQRFLEAVDPEIIVVSSGLNSQYGALHPDVEERYHRLGAQVFTTPEHGAVTFTTDGKALWVKTEGRGAK